MLPGRDAAGRQQRQHRARNGVDPEQHGHARPAGEQTAHTTGDRATDADDPAEAPRVDLRPPRGIGNQLGDRGAQHRARRVVDHTGDQSADQQCRHAAGLGHQHQHRGRHQHGGCQRHARAGAVDQPATCQLTHCPADPEGGQDRADSAGGVPSPGHVKRHERIGEPRRAHHQVAAQQQPDDGRQPMPAGRVGRRVRTRHPATQAEAATGARYFGCAGVHGPRPGPLPAAIPARMNGGDRSQPLKGSRQIDVRARSRHRFAACDGRGRRHS